MGESDSHCQQWFPHNSDLTVEAQPGVVLRLVVGVEQHNTI